MSQWVSETEGQYVRVPRRLLELCLEIIEDVGVVDEDVELARAQLREYLK